MDFLRHTRRMVANHHRFALEIIRSFRDTSQGLKLHHRILYTSCVFTGVVLVWYGLWDIVTAIPLLNRPLVALVTGVLLLVFTGSFFRELG